MLKRATVHLPEHVYEAFEDFAKERDMLLSHYLRALLCTVFDLKDRLRRMQDLTEDLREYLSDLDDLTTQGEGETQAAAEDTCHPLPTANPEESRLALFFADTTDGDLSTAETLDSSPGLQSQGRTEISTSTRVHC
jgi:hypothetical protein